MSSAVPHRAASADRAANPERARLPARSPRLMLARTAESVIGRIPGIALSAGERGRWVTAEGSEQIRGVVASAEPGGRYELELHLIVAWPPGPLERLADEIRRRVRAAARRSRLGPRLGAINVYIDAVQEPDKRELD